MRFPVSLLLLLAAVDADDAMCASWAAAGQCEANPRFMLKSCPQACKDVKAGKLGGAMDKDPNCAMWAAAGECDKNPTYMKEACPRACANPNAASAIAPDSHSECGQWAHKGECEKNPAFMKSGCASSCHRRAESRRDKDPQCAEYAQRGDCDERHSWMTANCWTSCDRLLKDALPHAECEAVVASGGCRTREGLSSCRTTCMARLQANRSIDTEGNCWYWATDGEVPPVPHSNPHVQRICCGVKAPKG